MTVPLSLPAFILIAVAAPLAAAPAKPAPAKPAPAPKAGQPLTRAEFQARMLKFFDRLDTDHNGILTLEEREKGRGKGAHPGCVAATAAHKA